jgi:ATP-dependent Clp protease ATP-binding subunit ClpA
MFELYTEKARRVIFFGRYEASQYGSPYIETEHLLLGLLREDPAVARRVLSSDRSVKRFIASASATDSIRRKITERGMLGEKTPTSVDLPLSNESKRVLAYGAEEAQHLGNRHIGTEHLLLGLLREKKCFAAQLLNEEGAVLERARKNIAEWQKHASQEAEDAESVEIHGEPWDLSDVEGLLQGLERFVWRKREWRPIDVVVDAETGKVCFDTNPPEESRLRLVPGGWARDWCLICSWELNADGGAEHSIGYTNGRQWLCAECYEQFFASKP